MDAYQLKVDWHSYWKLKPGGQVASTGTGLGLKIYMGYRGYIVIYVKGNLKNWRINYTDYLEVKRVPFKIFIFCYSCFDALDHLLFSPQFFSILNTRDLSSGITLLTQTT